MDATASAEFFAALAAADAPRAVATALGLVDSGVPAATVLLDLVAPALRRAGLLWQTGAWPLPREHAATCAVEEVVAAVGERRPGAGTRGHVVLGCPAGEWHALPAVILAEVLRQHGWRVDFLGPSAPASRFVSALHDAGPDVVAVSCTVVVHLPEAHRVITAARRRGTPVLVGGAGFGAGGRWGRALGADAAAGSAAQAIAVLEGGRWEQGPRCVAASGGVEYAVLRQRRAELVGRAVPALGALPAGGSEGDPGGSAHDDVAHIVDVLAAAVYVGESDVFAEGMRWLDALLTGRTGSCAGVHAVLDVLDAGLRDLPTAREFLARGRDRLTPL